MTSPEYQTRTASPGEASPPPSDPESPRASAWRSRFGRGASALLLVLIIGGSTGYIIGQVADAQEEGLLNQAPRHHRRIVREDGKTLLWARNLPGGDAEWFDMTEALVDPANFEHGIGKDRIPSIDKPAFLRATDRRLRDLGIRDSTTVIGWEHEGEAKAYPIAVLNRHELVNDWIGGKPVTVGW